MCHRQSIRLLKWATASLSMAILIGVFAASLASGSANSTAKLFQPRARTASTLTPWRGVPVALGSQMSTELAQAQALGATEVEVFAQWSNIEAGGQGVYD